MGINNKLKMMKSILLVVSTLLVASSAKGLMNPNVPLNGDFLVGFETGIFLRKTPDQIHEYKCPKAEIKIAEFKKNERDDSRYHQHHRCHAKRRRDATHARESQRFRKPS